MRYNLMKPLSKYHESPHHQCTKMSTLSKSKLNIHATSQARLITDEMALLIL